MKIIIISSHTPSLLRFRLDMMKDFISKGHHVIALGPESEDNYNFIFKEHDIDYKQIFVDRNGTNPIKDIKTFRNIFKILNKEKPDKVFVYQAKTIVYGSLAAKLSGTKEIYPLIAGVGSIFIGKGIKKQFVRLILKNEYKIACKISKKVFFHNNHDKDLFIKSGIVEEYKTKVINGSGVNLDVFKPRPLPTIQTFLFIGRLLKDKGIIEYLEACRMIKVEHPEVRCLLVGPFDTNPSSLKEIELKKYIDEGVIEYFGEQGDVRPFIEKCSTYVLPSYHEGTPKTILEAMAMGRAIITTNAPGCKDTIIDGENGFLVSVKSSKEIYDKMKLFIEDRRLSKIFGKKSYMIAKKKYDVKNVNKEIIRTMNM